MIKSCTPLGRTYQYGGPHHHWHRYHRIRHWRDGLIALGDSVAALYPIYGHSSWCLLNRMRCHISEANSADTVFVDLVPSSVVTVYVSGTHLARGCASPGRTPPPPERCCRPRWTPLRALR